MKNLTKEIEATIVPKGSVAIWWLAQAGFAFKNDAGQVIYLDPYLSELVERVANFKRLTLSPVEAEEVRADWFVSTHEHPDHLDTDAMPIIARNNPKCRFVGAQSCSAGFTESGIPLDRQLIVSFGEEHDLGSVKMYTARADHGELSPYALALLLDFGSVKVLFTGDTSYRPEWLQPLMDKKPDVLLPCINEAFGNLGAVGAAKMTAIAAPRMVIPCHFWMFKEHGGDPETFVKECAERCPNVQVKLLTPGEGVTVTPDSIGPVA